MPTNNPTQKPTKPKTEEQEIAYSLARIFGWLLLAYIAYRKNFNEAPRTTQLILLFIAYPTFTEILYIKEKYKFIKSRDSFGDKLDLNTMLTIVDFLEINDISCLAQTSHRYSQLIRFWKIQRFGKFKEAMSRIIASKNISEKFKSNLITTVAAVNISEAFKGNLIKIAELVNRESFPDGTYELLLIKSAQLTNNWQIKHAEIFKELLELTKPTFCFIRSRKMTAQREEVLSENRRLLKSFLDFNFPKTTLKQFQRIIKTAEDKQKELYSDVNDLESGFFDHFNELERLIEQKISDSYSLSYT